MSSDPRDVVARALERTQRAGADAADALLLESDSIEARVRAEEIDFVVQAREKTLGIRALVRGPGGARSAITSTSDLSPEAVDRMADETVALARATAEDPAPRPTPGRTWPSPSRPTAESRWRPASRMPGPPRPRPAPRTRGSRTPRAPR